MPIANDDVSPFDASAITSNAYIDRASVSFPRADTAAPHTHRPVLNGVVATIGDTDPDVQAQWEGLLIAGAFTRAVVPPLPIFDPQARAGSEQGDYGLASLEAIFKRAPWPRPR